MRSRHTVILVALPVLGLGVGAALAAATGGDTTTRAPSPVATVGGDT